VNLAYAAKQRTSAYSGGMKRRLSVAVALIGDPQIVYLDEPTVRAASLCISLLGANAAPRIAA